jgi:hypothetical protein
MKAILRRDFPDLHLLTNNDANAATVEEALKVPWERLPQDLIDRLIDSVPWRLEAVVRARGWYTKY